MRRELASIFLLALLLGLFAGYAWLTRHPEAPILERAAEWPVVGPMAVRFREAYLPPAGPEVGSPSEVDWPRNDGSPPGSAGGGGPGVGVPMPQDPSIHDARPWIWLEEGTEIRAAPTTRAPRVATTSVLANLPYDERRGDWYRVRKGTTEGWALVRGQPLAWQSAAEGGPVGPMTDVTTPVLPLPSRPPDPEWLGKALDLLGPDVREATVGPYRLYTDLAQPRFIDRMDAVVSQLEDLYRERFGLEPIEGAREVIVLYALRADYDALSHQEERLRGIDAAAYVSRGVVVLYAEGRSRGGVVSSLMHELLHLLNRRALGPALPPWLGEGISDDLSMARVDPDGRILPESLGGETTRTGRRILRRGGRAWAALLQQEDDEGRLLPLETLIGLDWTAFVADERGPIHYSQSAFFVRFLLSDWLAGTGQGFREFLADTARGVPITQEALLRHLGRSWAELEQGFRVWLRLQYLAPKDEVAAPGE